MVTPSAVKGSAQNECLCALTLIGENCLIAMNLCYLTPVNSGVILSELNKAFLSPLKIKFLETFYISGQILRLLPYL